jgi:hypothetical protein
MNADKKDDPHRVYDRQLLLNGPKRDTVLDLAEVQRYGVDSYGDADYVSIYGMRPADWHAIGVRLLGRTAVECTRDRLADAIARDIAAIARTGSRAAGTFVIDPFVGSGNTLYWILRHVPGARGLGFELDTTVFRLTIGNFAVLASPLEIQNSDYRIGLMNATLQTDRFLITFIAPPWGDALSTSGLDLLHTTPPIAEIVEFFFQRFPQNRVLCAIQIYETVEPASMADMQRRFDWSAVRIYSLNAPGQNHGILLGTRGWMPEAVTPAGGNA